MNSVMARNGALVLIFCLLWHVLGGIYTNQSRYMTKRQNHLSSSQPEDSGCESAAKTKPAECIEDRRLTNDEIHQIMMTRERPNWAKKSGDRLLTRDEIEEIVNSGTLPKR